jgi:hypothetical protein
MDALRNSAANEFRTMIRRKGECAVAVTGGDKQEAMVSLRDLSLSDWARLDDCDQNIADDYHRVRRAISID